MRCLCQKNKYLLKINRRVLLKTRRLYNWKQIHNTCFDLFLNIFSKAVIIAYIIMLINKCTRYTVHL